MDGGGGLACPCPFKILRVVTEGAVWPGVSFIFIGGIGIAPAERSGIDGKSLILCGPMVDRIDGKSRFLDPPVRRETLACLSPPVARPRRHFSIPSASPAGLLIICCSRRGRNSRSRPGQVRARKRKSRPDRHQHGGQGGPVAILEDRVAKPLQRIILDLNFEAASVRFESRKAALRNGGRSGRPGSTDLEIHR